MGVGDDVYAITARGYAVSHNRSGFLTHARASHLPVSLFLTLLL